MTDIVFIVQYLDFIAQIDALLNYKSHRTERNNYFFMQMRLLYLQKHTTPTPFRTFPKSYTFVAQQLLKMPKMSNIFDILFLCTLWMATHIKFQLNKTSKSPI